MSVVVFFILIASSISDIKHREVADLLSWGLVIAALILRVLFSFTLGVELIISGLIGLVICFIIALLLYYTGQWGGADSKLLIGMGAVIGVDFLFKSLSTELGIIGFDLLAFILLLLFSGAAYSLLWSIGLAIEHRGAFIHEFRQLFYESSGYFKAAIGVFVVSIFLGMRVHWIFSSLGLIVILSYLLFVGIVAVERSCFVQKRNILDLVEGDWLVEKVRGEKGATIYPKTIERSDLQKLLKWYGTGIVKNVVIKEGVPFVPAFLFGYILLLTQENWMPILQSFL